MRTVLILAWLAPAVAACGGGVGPVGVGRAVQVVAGEDVWGSLVAQVGGDHARVASLVRNPATDPHDYEPTAADARSVAAAAYVVVNGAGYDPWLDRLVEANPLDGRVVLDVATMAGRRQGDNPHMWYSPTLVHRVVARVAADLGRLDPSDAGYFTRRAAEVSTTALRRYDDLRAAIRARFHGTRVGATESIFVDLAADLQLDLVTPPSFMRAVAEGEDPTPQDRATVEAQVSRGDIAVLVYNSQNATPDIQGLIGRANGRHVAVVAVTETLVPAGATFQDWQVRQLEALQQALAAAVRT